MKNYFIATLITILSTILFMTLKYDAWTILAFINSATITSLILIIIGATLFVSGQGFFSGIAYSFRRFFKKTSKKWEMLDEPDEEYVVKKHSFSLTLPFLLLGGSLFLLALILSFIFY
ncbi:MAG TPA: DUF3899 domain-containing protein [Virgibacillus sp.]|nr:DUF3899 domain-containing protein [Virgibacillus sp.]